ncbi:MAG: hypothetical protein HUU56_09435 [Bdellovibrionaceae bacterium]|nr:hypothetical protein [Pseudobdellovibrionaceae bacterium]
MSNSTNEHEKLFDEICNKLNELSHREDNIAPQSSKIEKMQTQIKKFHNELQDTQDEFRQKIKSLENVQVSNSEINQQFKLLTEQLQAERNVNTKLNADLVKAHEISLQLQLEIQGLKSRAMQMQSEEKKYSYSLQEKIKLIQRDLELSQALKEEITLELAKAKNQFIIEKEDWIREKENFSTSLAEWDQKNSAKDSQIEELNKQIESMSQSLNEIELAANNQSEAMKNLMTVAENKIVELKLAYDKKCIESQDYYQHLQQSMSQQNLLKQENQNLKEYITKVNIYLQQIQQQQQTQQSSNLALQTNTGTPAASTTSNTPNTIQASIIN